jgi:hypothetical protein
MVKCWIGGHKIEDIKRDLRALDDHQVRWARRSANMLAPKLSKERCGLELNKIWFIIGLDYILSDMSQLMTRI